MVFERRISARSGGVSTWMGDHLQKQKPFCRSYYFLYFKSNLFLATTILFTILLTLFLKSMMQAMAKSTRTKSTVLRENSVRLYTSTNKLKLYGANYALLRDGLMNLLTEQTSTSPPTPSCSSPTTATSITATTLRSLQEDIVSLRSEVNFIKTRMPTESTTRSSLEELQEDLRVSRKEVENLKEVINIQKDSICKIQNERDSLLTAISLLVSDRKELHSNSDKC